MFKSVNLTVALVFALAAVALSVLFYILDGRLPGRARSVLAWISLVLYALIPVGVFLFSGGMGDAVISLGCGALTQLILMLVKGKNKDGSGDKKE